MRPIVELNMDFAAPVTVDSIPVNVWVNDTVPSHENQDVRDFHTSMTHCFRPFHLLTAVVDIPSHTPERNVAIPVNVQLAVVFMLVHIPVQKVDIAVHMSLHFWENQSRSPSHQSLRASHVSIHWSWNGFVRATNVETIP